MRLIDADRLFGELCDHLEEDEDTERAWVDIEAIVQVFNHAPTVDAVPVEWIKRWSKEPMTEKDMKLAEQCEWNILEWLIADWQRKEE